MTDEVFMRQRGGIAIGIVLYSLILGCSSSSSHHKLAIAARALSDAADKCLLDVRDRRLKYESAANCMALDALAGQYIEAGGLDKNEPIEYRLIAETARATAWSARAISASGNPGLRLW
jgi:hypothetical protein